MRRIIGLMGVLAAILALAAGNAAADHVGQTVDCGSAGTFTVVGNQTAAGFDAPIGETNLFLLGDTTSVLVIKQVLVGGQLRFANPGFAVNSAPVVTCAFSWAEDRFSVHGRERDADPLILGHTGVSTARAIPGPSVGADATVDTSARR